MLYKSVFNPEYTKEKKKDNKTGIRTSVSSLYLQTSKTLYSKSSHWFCKAFQNIHETVVKFKFWFKP